MKKIASVAGNKKGGAMLEFALCFPILFVFFLFIVQFAQILLTWQVLHYAAFMGARTALTCNTSERDSRAKDAVLRILAVVSNSVGGDSEKGDAKYSKIDGWGYLPGTKYVDKQTEVSFDVTGNHSEVVMCTVKFKMFLYVPVAGKIISYFADDSNADKDKWKQDIEDQGVALNPALIAKYSNTMTLNSLKIPYIEIESKSAVSIPYDTKIYPTGN